ncbi:MAG: dicarboxylate/amino acid:cation symporter [Planctomycetes bacterium]|nr:dicarboxylate/amino acid:cation symporter [Planctomycetota bacterium]
MAEEFRDEPDDADIDADGDNMPEVGGEQVEDESRLTRIMTSSWTLLGAIVVGILLVKWVPQAAGYMRPFGEAYQNFLQMTIIPFAVSATVASLARIMRRRESAHLVRRTAWCAAVFFMGAVLYGIVVAMVFRDQVEPSDDSYAYIGKMMFENSEPGSVADDWAIFEIDSRRAASAREAGSLKQTLLSSIPDNVFLALAQGDMVKILIFFFLFALTARYMPENGYRVIQSFADGVLAAFVRILEALYFLAAPGIACIIADTFADIDISLLWQFMGFIVLLLGSLVLAMVLCVLIVWVRSRRSLPQVVGAIQDSIFIAAAANSELLAMPKAMTGLSKLGFDKKIINIVMPLSINLIPNGSAIVFAVAAIFCAKLHAVPMTMDTVITLMFTVPLAAIATVQSGPLVWYGFLSIPLRMFGISIGPTLIVLYAIDFMVDRVMSTLEVCTASALVAIVKPATAPYEAKSSDDG